MSYNMPTGMTPSDVPDFPDPWFGRKCFECRFYAQFEGCGLCLCECMTGGLVAEYEVVGRYQAACECFEETAITVRDTYRPMR